MSKTRMMGAGYAGSSAYYNTGTSGGVNSNKGGGSKLQGLAPTTNKPVRYALRNIKRRANGERRNVVFCMNQIGGIGAVGGGNRSRMFAPTADGVKDCIPGSYQTKAAALAAAEKLATSDTESDAEADVESDVESDTESDFTESDFTESDFTESDVAPKLRQPEILCLTPESSITIVNNKGKGNKYVLNGETFYKENRKYGLNTGTYTITGVPESHPVAILNHLQTNNINYVGNPSNVITGIVGNILYDFYYGDVTINVNGDFNNASLQCLFHANMGEDLLVFSGDCKLEPEPEPEPEPCFSGLSPACESSFAYVISNTVSTNEYTWNSCDLFYNGYCNIGINFQPGKKCDSELCKNPQLYYWWSNTPTQCCQYIDSDCGTSRIENFNSADPNTNEWISVPSDILAYEMNTVYPNFYPASAFTTCSDSDSSCEYACTLQMKAGGTGGTPIMPVNVSWESLLTAWVNGTSLQINMEQKGGDVWGIVLLQPFLPGDMNPMLCGGTNPTSYYSNYTVTYEYLNSSGIITAPGGSSDPPSSNNDVYYLALDYNTTIAVGEFGSVVMNQSSGTQTICVNCSDIAFYINEYGVAGNQNELYTGNFTSHPWNYSYTYSSNSGTTCNITITYNSSTYSSDSC